jgi:tRNA acetyltransferase TAN1
MIVIFDDSKCEESEDEFSGITEIENTLENINLKLFIKESECSNVVFVECEINCIEAARKLKNTSSSRIFRVVPIDSVLTTNFDAIINEIRELSIEKIHAGDTFNVNCDVMNYPKLTEPQIKNFVKAELNKLDLNFDDLNPRWDIYIEIIGENTGLSILKSDDLI